MSADKTITVACVECDTEVTVPADAVGEMFAIDFSKRHDHDPLDPEDRDIFDTMIRASDRGIGSITMFRKPSDSGSAS